MTERKEKALRVIDEKRELLCTVSEEIWDHPEVLFHEEYASDILCKTLEDEGFQVTRELAGIKTAFSGRFGAGQPVIGFLGEFDALPGMSQQAGIFEKKPVEAGQPGHGCGHNLLGVGSLGAALAVKRYLTENKLPGTVIYFGCPAEEGGSGKGFMARAHVFDDVDVAFTWHPGEVNSVATENTMANYQISYRFHGTSAHAAMEPERGRSALDALELMNTGVQYLREHVPSSTRIHYAITDAGGRAPGIVQDHAEALYLMRALTLSDVRELYRRINLIAEGAAMMTETKVEIEFIKACSNIIINSELNQVMQRNLEEIPSVIFDEEDLEYARKIQQTTGAAKTYFDSLYAECEDPEKRKVFEADMHAPIHAVPLPLARERQGFVSSDVGDVSWNCPVSQINGATTPAGTAIHSWQMVSVGKSPMAQKGMLYAAKVMAGSAIDAFEDPAIIQRAKAELDRRKGGRSFVSPIPEGINPRVQ
ncbi:MAG: amidohydrolase [Clostridia bacterium]|nr:amidohydrolase [Clostridia bacterium]